MFPVAFLKYQSLVVETAKRYGYDASLLAAQAHAESAWKADAVSSAGAKGLMQFIDSTWRQYGRGQQFDPAASLDAGVRYMRDLMARYSDIRLALAAYNCGPGNVQKAIRQAGSSAWAEMSPYLPKETQNYVPRVLRYQSLYQTIKSAAFPVGAAFLLLLGVFALRRFI